MTLYESLKQFFFPNISIWESHLITIIFSTVCGVVAAYFVFQKQVELTNTLIDKNIESEHLRKQLQETVERLEKTLSEVKTLTGMLPICAVCKKIRDDQGYWNQIESYIQRHSEIDFSHSLCPECAEKMYPEFHKKEND